MTATNKKIFPDFLNAAAADSQRGASILEILLAIAIVALLSPFVYNQISETSDEIRDIGKAKRIMNLREPALNFVRLNQNKWPETAQIKLDDEERAQISDSAHAAFVDKYQVKGAVTTDVYLAFNINNDGAQAARIAKHIGTDAAILTPDGVAYGASWAVAAPDFEPGDLVYRINYNFSGDDDSKYLHRGTSGEDDFNVMHRNLNMGRFNIYGIGTAAAKSGQAVESYAAFAEAKDAAAAAVYFASGANMDASAIAFGSVRVNGDITGFRNITAKKLNRDGFSTTGGIIADRAKINNAVIVGGTMNLKSDTTRTVSGFSEIIAHSLTTSYVSATEMFFAGNFGLTVSGELLMSTMAPIQIGRWYFPSSISPKFSTLELTRARMPAAPDGKEFDILIKAGWKNAQPKQ